MNPYVDRAFTATKYLLQSHRKELGGFLNNLKAVLKCVLINNQIKVTDLRQENSLIFVLVDKRDIP